MNTQNGFTLIELMTAIAVMLILLAVAVPDFSQVIQGGRMTSTTNGLVSTLNLARSEAIKRGGTVTVSATDDDWNDGWTVVVGATTLRSFDPPPKGLAVAGTANDINFNGLGSATTATFTLCDATLADESGRQISVTATGRVVSSTFDCD